MTESELVENLAVVLQVSLENPYPRFSDCVREELLPIIRDYVQAQVGAAYAAAANVEFDERPVGDPNPRYEDAWASAYRTAIFSIRKAIRVLIPADAAKQLEREKLKARIESLSLMRLYLRFPDAWLSQTPFASMNAVRLVERLRTDIEGEITNLETQLAALSQRVKEESNG